jgi:hypothetical protein
MERVEDADAAKDKGIGEGGREELVKKEIYRNIMIKMK